VRKSHATFGEFVQVGSFQDRVTVAPEAIATLLVCGDQD
jgi:hypothetical protein